MMQQFSSLAQFCGYSGEEGNWRGAGTDFSVHAALCSSYCESTDYSVQNAEA